VDIKNVSAGICFLMLVSEHHLILLRAMLRVDTSKNESIIQQDNSRVLSMRAKIGELQEERTEREQLRLKQLVCFVSSRRELFT
jgi:hypothetical protein